MPGGFDGNAQSFRIVNRLALRCEEYDGLNLTRATCNAILKYPWLRTIDGKRHKKWGVYSQEEEQFTWARKLAVGDVKSAEAEIMDWADDVTYAVHDVNDFFRAQLIPLDRLAGKTSLERERFYEEVFSRVKDPKYSRAELEEAFEKLGSYRFRCRTILRHKQASFRAPKLLCWADCHLRAQGATNSS